MRNAKLAAIFCAVLFTTAAAHDEGAHATYLGNEGVMIARGETKILFDAFYLNSYGQYALVPQDIADALMNGAPPYDGVDALFISHVHGDHFSPAPTIAYLRANEDARLYGSKQIYDAIIEAGVAADDPLTERIVMVDMAPSDAPQSFEIDGLHIDVVAIPHAGNRPNIQNLAWRVTLDDATTIMHLGDAGPVVADFSRHLPHFKARETHTAFPPYWFFGHEAGELILDDIIGAPQVIGVHVPERAAGDGEAWRARAGGDLFTDPGETRDLPR